MGVCPMFKKVSNWLSQERHSLLYINVHAIYWPGRFYWPVANGNGDIFMALLVALLFTLCVQWINYEQHTPDKVAIVVVVIDWFGSKTLLCWPVTKCSLQTRLRCEHAPSHHTKIISPPVSPRAWTWDHEKTEMRVRCRDQPSDKHISNSSSILR